MSLLPPVLQILLATVAVIAAFFDLRWRRIPNWLTAAGLLTGLALNSFLYEWHGLRQAGLGIGLAFLVYFPLYLLRAMGAGDVKLMAAIGSIAGPANWLGIFVITSLLGGLLAILLILGRGRLHHTIMNLIQIVHEMVHFRAPFQGSDELDVRTGKGMTMPHGAVIGLGCLAFMGAAAVWAPR
jgi:prepilin peptidase CpaA